LMLFADMIEDRSVPLGSLRTGAPALLIPWPIGAWAIGKVFPTEFRRYAAVLDEVTQHPEAFQFGGDEWPNWLERRWSDWGRLLFKPHATLNLEATLMDRLAAVADGDPGHYSEAGSAYLKWRNTLPSRNLPASLYNPFGKRVAGIDVESWLDYP